jgi:soluble lytic murein transglycosylase-like protein
MKSLIVFLPLFLSFSSSSLAKEVPNAYRTIAKQYHVPADILYAIALAESGYRHKKIFNPWPWTLNIKGAGKRYRNHHQAKTALLNARKTKQHVDVGLMQINTKWHGHRVFQAEQLLDPFTNLKVGATILKEFHKKHGDWWVAVGLYHSPSNPTRAESYTKRVRARHRKIRGTL